MVIETKDDPYAADAGKPVIYLKRLDSVDFILKLNIWELEAPK